MQQSSVLNSQIIEGLRDVEKIKGNATEETELENIEREYIKSLRIGIKESMYSSIQGSISSLISTAGNGLSGGEKQRIALARAFLKKSNFYILDESTSNLDFATENIIFDMIYNKFRNKSMLIIAHRLSTVKNCDEIIVLNNGEIAEQGTHEELLGKQGMYYRLWNMQLGNFVI